MINTFIFATNHIQSMFVVGGPGRGAVTGTSLPSTLVYESGRQAHIGQPSITEEQPITLRQLRFGFTKLTLNLIHDCVIYLLHVFQFKLNPCLSRLVYGA